MDGLVGAVARVAGQSGGGTGQFEMGCGDRI